MVFPFHELIQIVYYVLFSLLLVKYDKKLSFYCEIKSKKNKNTENHNYNAINILEYLHKMTKCNLK